MERSVAIVGRPNVGKSRLFNCLIGKRVAIVHDQPGVTRDVVVEEVDNDFVLMDTGGIGMEPTKMSSERINKATEEQVDFAINAANLILFVVDGREGLTSLDHSIAETLRKKNKPIILVVNKMDFKDKGEDLSSFYSLGFKEVITTSAEHYVNIGSLLTSVKESLGPKPETPEAPKEKRVNISFVGRPNVGKSSLVNNLLNEKRLIVTDIAGTTREAITSKLDYKAKNGAVWPFLLVDTAGLRRKGKVDSSVEYFSGLRTDQAIQESDVAFLVLDALDGVTAQDKKLAGQVIESGRGLIVVVNKWDFALKKFARDPLPGYNNEREFREAFVEAVRREFFFLPASPIIFTSALEGYGVERLLREARKVNKRMQVDLSTSKINKTLEDLMERQKPRVVHGKRFKVYYAVQVGKYPVKIKLFCNQELRLDDSYKRYLQNGFYENFDLDGCPIIFDLVGKKRQSTFAKSP